MGCAFTLKSQLLKVLSDMLKMKIILATWPLSYCGLIYIINPKKDIKSSISNVFLYFRHACNIPARSRRWWRRSASSYQKNCYQVGTVIIWIIIVAIIRSEPHHHHDNHHWHHCQHLCFHRHRHTIMIITDAMWAYFVFFTKGLARQ